jgi:hypothetical protein
MKKSFITLMLGGPGGTNTQLRSSSKPAFAGELADDPSTIVCCAAKSRNQSLVPLNIKSPIGEDWTFYMEGQEGLEPSTPCLRGRCSNQLSYWPT